MTLGIVRGHARPRIARPSAIGIAASSQRRPRAGNGRTRRARLENDRADPDEVEKRYDLGDMGRQERRHQQMQPVAVADLEVGEDGVVGREPDAVISRNLRKIRGVELLDVGRNDVGYDGAIEEHRRQKP
ncbi:hypothetical protein ACVOMS_10115 [Bradyrhizobium guangxiense]